MRPNPSEYSTETISSSRRSVGMSVWVSWNTLLIVRTDTGWPRSANASRSYSMRTLGRVSSPSPFLPRT